MKITCHPDNWKHAARIAKAKGPEWYVSIDPRCPIGRYYFMGIIKYGEDPGIIDMNYEHWGFELEDLQYYREKLRESLNKTSRWYWK